MLRELDIEGNVDVPKDSRDLQMSEHLQKEVVNQVLVITV